MIIDTSNAPCGPGFLPGPRLTEGRFAINRRRPRLRGWGVAGGLRACLRPPKFRRDRSLAPFPSCPPSLGRVGRGCRWDSVFPAVCGRRSPAAVRAGGSDAEVRALTYPSSASLLPPGVGAAPLTVRLRPQIRRDNPLNLSILLSGGKETNQDSLSSGERRGTSPALNPRPSGGRGNCGV